MDITVERLRASYHRPMSADAFPLAAVADDGTGQAAELLAQQVQRWQQAGRRVRGLLMRPCPSGRDCASDMVLVDVRTGDDYLVSQNLGAGSEGCRADPAGFARAAQVLRHALDEPAEVVVVNRFGKLESVGQGFADEVLSLVAAGIPVLTMVHANQAEAWATFSGDQALLAPEAGAINDWFAQL